MPSREPVISEWCGHDRYACPVDGCAFDTLERERFDEHLAAAHPLPAPKPVKAAPVTTATKRGAIVAAPAREE